MADPSNNLEVRIPGSVGKSPSLDHSSSASIDSAADSTAVVRVVLLGQQCRTIAAHGVIILVEHCMFLLLHQHV